MQKTKCILSSFGHVRFFMAFCGVLSSLVQRSFLPPYVIRSHSDSFPLLSVSTFPINFQLFLSLPKQKKRGGWGGWVGGWRAGASEPERKVLPQAPRTPCHPPCSSQAGSPLAGAQTRGRDVGGGRGPCRWREQHRHGPGMETHLSAPALPAAGGEGGA